MPALTPSFMFDLESNMRLVQANEYERLSRNLFWRKVASEMQTAAKKERINWLLDSAKLQYVNRLGGEVQFDDIVSQTTEFEYKAATAGLKLNRYQLEDHDGNGVQLAAHWSRQMGSYAGYWPQKQVCTAIRNGSLATSLSYDGETFFDTDHPVNPFDATAGTFANVFTGAASGSYPGALPIGGSTTLDVAIENIGKAIAYIQSIKLPNGEDPRMLKARAILAPPALTTRVQQLTNAKFIAQSAASGGGSGDVEAVIRNWGFQEPIEVTEFGAGFENGSDSTYYIVAEEVGSDGLGPIVYVNREPFQVAYHGVMTDAELSRKNEFEWHSRGANVVGYGHPYLLFKVMAT